MPEVTIIIKQTRFNRIKRHLKNKLIEAQFDLHGKFIKTQLFFCEPIYAYYEKERLERRKEASLLTGIPFEKIYDACWSARAKWFMVRRRRSKKYIYCKDKAEKLYIFYN